MQQVNVNLMLETTHDHIKNWFKETGGSIHDVTLPEMDKVGMMVSANILDKKVSDFNTAYEAVVEAGHSAESVAAYAEALIDVVICIQIAFAKMGLPYDDLLAHKVHVNMQKSISLETSEGSLIKPEGYKPAQFLAIIRQYVTAVQQQKLAETPVANDATVQ